MDRAASTTHFGEKAESGFEGGLLVQLLRPLIPFDGH